MQAKSLQKFAASSARSLEVQIWCCLRLGTPTVGKSVRLGSFRAAPHIAPPKKDPLRISQMSAADRRAIRVRMLLVLRVNVDATGDLGINRRIAIEHVLNVPFC